MRVAACVLLIAASQGCGRIDFERLQRGHQGAGSDEGDGGTGMADAASMSGDGELAAIDSASSETDGAATGAGAMIDASTRTDRPHTGDAGIDGRPIEEMPDSGTVDSGTVDSGTVDSGTVDSSTADSNVAVGDDAGTVQASDTCNQATPLSLGVPVSSTTCGATSTISSLTEGCEPAGTPDVFFKFEGQAGMAYTISISDGAYVQRMGNCSMTDTACVSSDTFTCSATGSCRVTYLVETVGGGCGSFTIEVN